MVDMDATEPDHVPVLPDATLALLDPQPGGVVVDATLGRGGHAALILPRLAPGGTLLGLDTDPANAAYARQRLGPLAADYGVTLIVEHANFAALPAVLRDHGLPPADGLLADLGFASNQMDDPARGLSFRGDGPLDMRLDPTRGVPASHLIATLPERELADLIYQLGEERLSRRIARKIVERRAVEPIETTGALAELVRRCYPPKARHGRIDPATRTFMALRIAVNGELEALDTLLRQLPETLGPGGRAAVISFHSLEDRRVKRAFLAMSQEGGFERLTRKPLTADADEVAVNPRSRSAKLRGVEKQR